MSEIEMGNLYNMNQNLVEQSEKVLSNSALREKIQELARYIGKMDNNYYMLLCHERRDYTIFKTNQTVEGNEYNAKVLVNEVAGARGDIKGIDKTEDGYGYEIWVSIEDNSFNEESGEIETERNSYCYMFFPCDACVIDEV